jgi:hypothetical protein
MEAATAADMLCWLVLTLSGLAARKDDAAQQRVADSPNEIYGTS